MDGHETPEALLERLDASLGDGPAPSPVGDLLVSGRRALRRRRAATGAAALAVAAVVAGAALTSAPGANDSRGRQPDVASDPPSAAATASAAPAAVRTADAEQAGQLAGEPVGYSYDGTLLVQPAAVVHRSVENPFGLALPERSAAFDLTFHGQRIWYVAAYDGNGGGDSASQPAAPGQVSFQAWVDEQRSVRGGAAHDSAEKARLAVWPGLPDLQLVRLGPDGRLVPLDAVTLVEQRRDPPLGDAFAAAGDTSAVAEVRFEGRRYYALARRSPAGKAQYLAVPASEGGATLDDFVALAQQRYAGGGAR